MIVAGTHVLIPVVLPGQAAAAPATIDAFWGHDLTMISLLLVVVSLALLAFGAVAPVF